MRLGDINNGLHKLMCNHNNGRNGPGRGMIYRSVEVRILGLQAAVGILPEVLFRVFRPCKLGQTPVAGT